MPRSPRPSPDGRPVYEVNPEPRLVAALREAFGQFMPTDPYWIRIEIEIKQIAWMADQAGHRQFCAEYQQMDADAILRFLHHHGMIAEPKKRRGRPTRTISGLNVDQYLLALFAEDNSVAQLSPRALEKRTQKMFSASTYRASAVFRAWQRIRREDAAHAASITADEIEAGGLSMTAKGKKTVAGRERLTKEERRLMREADAWLAEHDLGEESRL